LRAALLGAGVVPKKVLGMFGSVDDVDQNRLRLSITQTARELLPALLQ